MTLHPRALVAAALAVGLATLGTAPATAEPQVDALTPGARIVTYAPGPGGAWQSECTAGWLARTADGKPVVLTAGHCARSGDAVVLWQGHDDSPADYLALGPATYVVHDPNSTDIAVVSVSESVAQDPRVLERRPVAAAVKLVIPGEPICFYGATSGRSCGVVTNIIPGYGIVATAKAQGGDSGGPAYSIDNTGVAYPVGIVVGGQDSTGRSVVQPITDVLREQNLTLMSGAEPSTEAVAQHR
ncbi:MAG: S1 family peptidase [Candidatus Nanopelagicales bacterium]